VGVHKFIILINYL